jgi:hypothetical protein
MKKKYNNKSIYFKNWTTKKLKEYYLSYYDAIYGQNPCYGMSDLRMINGIEIELEKRKIQIELTPKFY